MLEWDKGGATHILILGRIISEIYKISCWVIFLARVLECAI